MLHQEIPLPFIPRSATCNQRKSFTPELGAKFVICESCPSFATTVEPWNEFKASISSPSKPRCLVPVLVGELDEYLLDPLGELGNAANDFAHGHG